MRPTILSLAITIAAQAQVQVVLPSGHGTVEANGTTSTPFSGKLGRHQFLIDRTHLQPLGQGWLVREIWFRRDMTTRARNHGGVLQVQVLASSAVTSPNAPSEAFATNRGPNPVMVFQGQIALPTCDPAMTVPAPWDPAFAIRIPLDQPLVETVGDLCLEFVTQVATGQPQPGFWAIDAAWNTAGGGDVALLGRPCGGGDAAAGRYSLQPGNTLFLSLDHAPANAFSLHVLGSNAVSAWGVPLPIDLSPAGAPGCFLYTDLMAITPRVIEQHSGTPVGAAQVWALLPFTSQLLGATLFSQWLVFEPRNALGVTATNAVQVRLAGSYTHTGLSIVNSGDLNAATGIVRSHVFPVMRLVR